MMKKNSGFTLIELVIVIVILAILAVTALPRFIDTADDAQFSKNQAVAAAFEQGVKGTQLLWEVAGRPGNNGSNQNGPQVEYDGTLVTVDADTGWPVGAAGRDTGVNINNSADCLTVFTDIMSTNMTVIDRVNGNNPTAENRALADILATRTNDNTNGDQCNYYLIEAIPSEDNNPAEGIPVEYMGFSYNAETGQVSTFRF